MASTIPAAVEEGRRAHLSFLEKSVQEWRERALIAEAMVKALEEANAELLRALCR